MIKSSYESVFVARQPVFHPDETVWGYELLFRSGEENIATITDHTAATASVIADGVTLALDGMPPQARILINFPEELLLQDAGFALPKENCVVEILENVRPSREALAAVKRLKDEGYTIAVDDFFGQPELRPFLEMADIIKIDVLELDSDPVRIAKAIDGLAEGKAQLLAEKVEDIQTFHALKGLGFSLFQGFFFSKPEIIPGRKLTANEMTKLQLLAELSSPEFEPARLAEILQSDPSLSYRLFRFINAAGFGLRNKVTSLKRAIDMMGMLKAKQWLRTVIMADMNTTPKAIELSFMAVQRAKFMESICGIKRQGRCDPDVMFICGLFSLLDTMLGIDMERILQKLPLHDSIVEGLTSKGEINDMLGLAMSYERGRWYEAGDTLRSRGIETQDVDNIYAEAWAWALAMLGNAKEAEAVD